MSKTTRKTKNNWWVNQPDWGFEVDVKLRRLKITKRQLAEMIGVNYSQMCCVITGIRSQPEIKEKIDNGLEKLEKERETSVQQ